MITFQKTGYKSKSLVSDLALGFFDGVDNALWCYGFAAIIFSGVLAGFMPLMLVLMLVGWSLVGVFIAVTSRAPVHLINLDEQAIVILSTIGGLMVAEMGDAATGSRGLSTILAVISLTTLVVALSFLLVGRFHLTRVLELIPYPVICGFMAGIAWLLLQAGVGIAVDLPISVELVKALGDTENLFRLGLMAAGGFALLFITNRSPHAWSLPVAALAIGLVFFLVAYLMGYSKEQLQDENWLFHIDPMAGSAMNILALRSFFEIDVGFVLSVIPQILTIAFLAMLTASMSLSAMVAGGN
ncbi:MAG TPA: SulP family inorganic anion transporter, partial [Xanthomonadales bacterium]|nr:SulP family inorganic anion transporter [Xanthomonadales bacterium]